MVLVFVEFTREKVPSLFGRAICYFTGFLASHVRFRYVSRDGVSRLFHAIEDGVVVEDYIPGDEIVIASFPCMLSCSLEHFEGIIYATKGRPYGWWQCVFIALGLNFRFLKNRQHKLVCSELVGQILVDYFGLKIKGDRDSWTPREVYVALLDHFLKNGLSFERFPGLRVRSLPKGGKGL